MKIMCKKKKDKIFLLSSFFFLLGLCLCVLFVLDPMETYN